MSFSVMPKAREHEARIDDRAGARLVDRDALALEVGDRFDVGVLAGDDVDRLGIERRDEAQVLDLRLALVEPGAGIGPVGDVRLREAGLRRAALDRVDVRDRAVRGDAVETRPGDALAVGARDRVRDEAADRIVGAAGAAGADAEEGLALRKRQPRAARREREGAGEGDTPRDRRHGCSSRCRKGRYHRRDAPGCRVAGPSEQVVPGGAQRRPGTHCPRPRAGSRLFASLRPG